MSAPIDTPTLSPPQPHPCRSISNNEIGAEGASALAAILKETQIQELECAATPERSLFCQRPLTNLLSHHTHSAPRVHSLGYNNLTREAKQALQDAAGSSVRINCPF